MKKHEILNLIIKILCIFEIIPLVIYHFLYMSEFNFKDFMEKLYDKLNGFSNYNSEYYEAFEDLFNRYYDSTGLIFMALFFKSLAIFIAISLLLFLMYLLQIKCFCKQNDYLRYILSIIFLVLSFGVAFAYVVIAFNLKYKIKLKEEEIYIFDNDFNNEIKENIDYMYNRRIYMIVCVFLAQFFMICQITLIIVVEKFIKKNNSLEINFDTDIGVAPINSNENS